MKSFIQKRLFRISRAILRKYKPKIIGVTGSIGKTSAKEAIYSVLSSKFDTRKNIKNYNNEFGLPFTIIGMESPKRNPLKWLKLFLKSYGMIIFYSHYPQVLVLEMGIDRPGDMDKLVDLVHPHVAVLTTIGLSHIEYFSNEQQILEEKSKIFRELQKNDFAVLNMDDLKVRQAIPKIRGKIITYGFDSSSDFKITDYKTTYVQNSFGTLAHFAYKGKTVPVFLAGILGVPHISAAAAAGAAGVAMGMELTEIADALVNYKPEPGRMRVVPGMDKSVIIDDSYNAAPLSTKTALDELVKFPAQRRVAVLGDMLELGDLSDQSHRDIAGIITKSNINYFIAVGPQMKLAYNELKRTMFNEAHLYWFEKSTDAIETVKNLLEENTVVLVKGSQGMRMEKISREIIADKKNAHNLIPRQTPDWLKK